MTRIVSNVKDRVTSVMIAQIAVETAPVKLRTVLGSCIGIAMCDPRTRLGGIAHVVLPDSRGSEALPGKFADTAVPRLIDMLTRQGGRRSRFSVKLAGGANMFRSLGTTVNNIGEMNKEAVRRVLEEHRIPIREEHLGGDKGRRMTLDPETGHVLIEIQGQEPVRI